MRNKFLLTTWDCLQNPWQMALVSLASGLFIIVSLQNKWRFWFVDRFAMAVTLVLPIVLITFINLSQGNLPLPTITPEYCNSTEYFDTICMRCKRCGRDDTQANLQHRASDGKLFITG